MADGGHLRQWCRSVSHVVVAGGLKKKLFVDDFCGLSGLVLVPPKFKMLVFSRTDSLCLGQFR